jgi:hypothetical protein
LRASSEAKDDHQCSSRSRRMEASSSQ